MTFDWKLYLLDETGRKFFGKGPMMLLLHVDQLGSLNRAAAEMSMSYNKALSMVETAEGAVGIPLLEKKTGGAGGGGSVLTEAAKDLIQKYQQFEATVDHSVRQHFLEVFGDKSEG